MVKLLSESCYLVPWCHSTASQKRVCSYPQSVPTIAGADVTQDKLRLIDDTTMDTLHRFECEKYEMACSLASMTFADDNNAYYLLGTAYVLPDEPEPTKVCLICLWGMHAVLSFVMSLGKIT